MKFIGFKAKIRQKRKNRENFRKKWKNYFREQLEELLEIQDIFIKEINDDNKKKKFRSIRRATFIFNKIFVKDLCILFHVSKSGYYK